MSGRLFLLMLATATSYGQSAKSAKETASPVAIADAMVASARVASAGVSSAPGVGSNNPFAALAIFGTASADDQKRQNEVEGKIILAAREATGESFSGREQLNLVMALNTFMVSHKTNFDNYEGRAKKVNTQLLSDWQAAQDKLGVRQAQLTLVLFGIIFQDLFWEGSDWKAGNPRQAVTRLTSLPKESVAKWVEAAGLKDASWAAANSLAAVDGLFVNGIFQTGTFEGALPLAQLRMAKK